MGTTRLLPGFVGGQHAGQELTGRHAGQLSWVGRVAALFLGVVGILTFDASTAAADQATTSGDHAALAVNANGGRLSQAPVTQALDYVALGDSYSSGSAPVSTTRQAGPAPAARCPALLRSAMAGFGRLG
jgi:hypothetical protein